MLFLQAATSQLLTMAENSSTANSDFDKFMKSRDFLEILKLFDDICGKVGIDSHQYDGFFDEVKAKMNLSWKCRKLWELYETKANHPVYKNQECCRGMRCLVIGAGPVGLRSAIEAALLGAKVEVVEKRSYFSRNNVLHLWPFLVEDLRALGAKSLYPQFCPGGIDHISIRRLQVVLLKVALFLGVKVHPGVEFTSLVDPSNRQGWKAQVTPASSVVSSYEFDVMIGADGKKYLLPGFVTKEFRPTLAIAITTNFVHRHTNKEANIEELSGVVYFCRQNFFKSLSAKLGIDLENLVYYKDETHYFVMTIKKQSLLSKGALKEDFDDVSKLLSPVNVCKDVVKQLVKEVAVFATDGQFEMEALEFEKNHRGEDDVALFDFTSLFAAEHASRVIEREGKRLLTCLVGDTLIESFWPTGVGCARGFLGAFDAVWMMKGFSEGRDVMELIVEREKLFNKLVNLMPYSLHKKTHLYTIDPSTRYKSLLGCEPSASVEHLYDRGEGPQVPTAVVKSGLLEQRKASKLKRKKAKEGEDTSSYSDSSSDEDSKHSPLSTDTDDPSHSAIVDLSSSSKDHVQSTDQLSTDQLSTDQLSTDQLSTDQLSTDQLSTDQLSTDQLSTDQLSTDQLSTDQLSTDQLSTNQLSTDQLSTDVLSTDQLSTGQLSTDQLSTDDVICHPISSPA